MNQTLSSFQEIGMTMTIKNIKTYITATIFTLVLTSSFVPAFAVSYSGPWSPNQADPSGCIGTIPNPKKCAQANSSGNSFIYTYVQNTFSSATAWVRNNANLSTGQVGSNPTLTVAPGATQVFGDTKVDFDGYITANAAAGEAALWIDGLIFKDGTFYARYGANAKIGGTGSHVATNYISTGGVAHSGTHTYKLGGEFEALSSTNLFSGVNEVDFWSGTHYVKVTQLSLYT